MYKLTLWRLHFFISLITGNWTAFNVPPLPNSSRDLKSYPSLKTKKFWVLLYPRTVFFPEAQAEKADKRSWFDWAVPSLAFFFFLSSALSLALSLTRSLPAWQPSRAVLAELQPVPVCLSSCFPKDALCESINRFKNRKLWVGNQILAPTTASSAKWAYRFHGFLPFTMAITFLLADRGALEAIHCSQR